MHHQHIISTSSVHHQYIRVLHCLLCLVIPIPFLNKQEGKVLKPNLHLLGQSLRQGFSYLVTLPDNWHGPFPFQNMWILIIENMIRYQVYLKISPGAHFLQKYTQQGKNSEEDVCKYLNEFEDCARLTENIFWEYFIVFGKLQNRPGCNIRRYQQVYRSSL